MSSSAKEEEKRQKVESMQKGHFSETDSITKQGILNLFRGSFIVATQTISLILCSLRERERESFTHRYDSVSHVKDVVSMSSTSFSNARDEDSLTWRKNSRCYDGTAKLQAQINEGFVNKNQNI